MALVKLNDIYSTSDSGSNNDNFSLESFHVYTGSDRVGTVKDVLVDEQEGLFRYLIVDTGFWVFGKTVLLPIGLARFDYDAKCVYVDGLTKEQVEHLPEFNHDLEIDQDYEEQVRGVYRPLIGSRSGSYETPETVYNRDTYSYEQDSSLYRRNSEENDYICNFEQQLARRERLLH
ncbi:MAG: PRC-barrel domain-containing protein [Oculatellaceae cyanobacterium bins.114]|nr:PRC-barrel domain-containing protein [Oculatellaceae cyanobacterium bins.114]